MKVLVGWAQRSPADWEEVDATQWHTLPNKGIPSLGERGDYDNNKGAISDVMIQGVEFNGQDHVAVAPLIIGNDEGVRVWCWNNDPDDYPIGQRVARILSFLPLAPDPTFGSGNRERLLDSIRNEPGITEQRRAEVLAWHNDPAHFPLNTRQSQVVYAEGDRYDRLLAGLPQNTTLRPWAEFENSILQTIDPAITRHGIWVPDEHWERQVEARTPTGWMHWCEHLPESEWEWERNEIRHNRQMRELRAPRRVLKEQRAQGRYSLATHTITYYQRDTTLAAGWISAQSETQLSLSTAASATIALTSGAGIVSWAFSSPANEPNSADWPSGVYHIQANVTAISASAVGGYIVEDTLKRVSSDLASLLESSSGIGSLSWTTTGLKLFTSSAFNFAAGAANNRFGIYIGYEGDSHGDAMTLTVNTTDSYADGPWTTAVTDPVVQSRVFPNRNVGPVALRTPGLFSFKFPRVAPVVAGTTVGAASHQVTPFLQTGRKPS